jgi:hypothetical protein
MLSDWSIISYYLFEMFHVGSKLLQIVLTRLFFENVSGEFFGRTQAKMGDFCPPEHKPRASL